MESIPRQIRPRPWCAAFSKCEKGFLLSQEVERAVSNAALPRPDEGTQKVFLADQFPAHKRRPLPKRG